VGAEPLCETALRLEPLQRRESRTDAVLAALALAGERGADEEDLFASVWGFPYVRERHHDVLAMTLSRARTRVAHAATVERKEGRVVFRASASIVLPEPRGASHTDDRVLLLIAGRRAASAAAIGSELGLPVRSVQAALKTLVGEGYCGQQRSGRGVE
jgi:hypothetical protein